MSSISIIAHKAGVSKMTVSRVINNSPHVSSETRERIQTIMKAEGYTRNVLASTLSRGVSMDIVGVITGIENVFSHYYFMELVRTIERSLDVYDHSLFFFNVVETEDREVIKRKLGVICEQYHARALKGVVVIGPPQEDMRLKFLAENSVKGVVVGGKIKSDQFGYIDVNNAEGVHLMVRYLVKKGHTKIGVIHGPDYLTAAQERRAAFGMALADAGLVIRSDYSVRGEFTTHSGRDAALKLLSLADRPTAIVAMNDDMAEGVYQAAEIKGRRIPEDLSVVGFDDLDVARQLQPGLTTIAQPFSVMGEQVAQCFKENNFVCAHTIIPVLIERGSVKKM